MVAGEEAIEDFKFGHSPFLINIRLSFISNTTCYESPFK